MTQKKKSKLTRKQSKFVEKYIETGNGTVSAKEAYDVKNNDTAKSIASENLTKPYIINAIHEALPDLLLSEKHLQLLNSTKVEHMVFPLGPKGEDDINLSGGRPDTENDDGEMDEDTRRVSAERTTLTDQEIIEMLAGVNCKVKRIVHGETARHVYYWTYDNKAIKDALDMAFKIKGTYAPIKADVKQEITDSTLTEEEKIKLRSLIK